MNVLSTRLFNLALVALVSPTLGTSAHARPNVPPPGAIAAAFVRAEPTASELTHRLEAAIDATNEDPEVHAPALRQVLDDVAAVPGVVGRSSKLQGLRIEGLLYLARAQLVLDERDEAVAAIDEAIRVSGGSVSNVGDFGPSLADLYDERRAAPELRPLGTVYVGCTGGPCRVFLDGRVVGTGTDVTATGLPLGPHVLRIEPQERAPPEPFEQHVITFTEAESQAEFAFTVPALDESGGSTAPKTPQGGSGRKLPRWAGIVGMTLGSVAVAGGAFAMGIDGRCPDLSSPTKNDCVDVHDSLITGGVVLGLGVAAVTGFGVAFGIGEAKDKRHASAQAGREASVSVRFRF